MVLCELYRRLIFYFFGVDLISAFRFSGNYDHQYQ
jgi:hypothetical protein